MSTVQILTGDCRELLKTLPDESVHCVVTSPPFFGLRDYGVSGQLGMEATPDEYVEVLVAVFRQVRRVLRCDGTLWLNLGDTYAGYHGNKNAEMPLSATNGWVNGTNENLRTSTANRNNLKPKDLIGIPWRVAFALQADGWWLRSDVIWSKANPMPESVQDRPTKAHEYLFLLTRSERYHYDANAIAEPVVEQRAYPTWEDRKATGEPLRRGDPGGSGHVTRFAGLGGNNATRNKRSVWTIPTLPFKGFHFATFPEALVEPCILAGSSERGCCSQCGAPWRRVLAKAETAAVESEYDGKWSSQDSQASGRRMLASVRAHRKAGAPHDNPFPGPRTIAWEPTCGHFASVQTCTVLDPFAGSGTVGVVALKHNRNAILLELSVSYCDLIRQRIDGVQRRLPIEDAS